jgi:hypothetical protein
MAFVLQTLFTLPLQLCCRKVDGTLDCSQQPEWEYLRGSGRGLVRVLGADIHHERVQLTW